MAIVVSLLFALAGLAEPPPTPSPEAGCKINVHVKNTGKKKIWISYTNDTAVKSKGGSWRRLKAGNWRLSDQYLNPGVKRGSDYSGAFGCSAKRRYRIQYICFKGPPNPTFTDYYPSATGWTTKQNLTIELKRCK